MILSVNLVFSSLFFIRSLSNSLSFICICFRTDSKCFLEVLLVVFSILRLIDAIATSGAVEEFVIVIEELPLIAKDPVAFILIL